MGRESEEAVEPTRYRDGEDGCHPHPEQPPAIDLRHHAQTGTKGGLQTSKKAEQLLMQPARLIINDINKPSKQPKSTNKEPKI
ncbi:hypothetical protein ACVNS2_24600 [Paenibacillus caseinilyticus]|uniref:hypothetical protein n=1 Tax=Paenibacillus mucilaginosus TaxID=61624 RepID=UPI0005A12D7D|nr:hypothetical protein [Paenibacillus mucilaginosus]